ncbi:MAG: hypothetical protein AAB297_09090, partial [Acidobacteriota bacterium]
DSTQQRVGESLARSMLAREALQVLSAIESGAEESVAIAAPYVADRNRTIAASAVGVLQRHASRAAPYSSVLARASLGDDRRLAIECLKALRAIGPGAAGTATTIVMPDGGTDVSAHVKT